MKSWSWITATIRLDAEVFYRLSVFLRGDNGAELQMSFGPTKAEALNQLRALQYEIDRARKFIERDKPR